MSSTTSRLAGPVAGRRPRSRRAPEIPRAALAPTGPTTRKDLHAMAESSAPLWIMRPGLQLVADLPEQRNRVRLRLAASAVLVGIVGPAVVANQRQSQLALFADQGTQVTRLAIAPEEVLRDILERRHFLEQF